MTIKPLRINEKILETDKVQKVSLKEMEGFIPVYYKVLNKNCIYVAGMGNRYCVNPKGIVRAIELNYTLAYNKKLSGLRNHWYSKAESYSYLAIALFVLAGVLVGTGLWLDNTALKGIGWGVGIASLLSSLMFFVVDHRFMTAMRRWVHFRNAKDHAKFLKAEMPGVYRHIREDTFNTQDEFDAYTAAVSQGYISKGTTGVGTSVKVVPGRSSSVSRSGAASSGSARRDAEGTVGGKSASRTGGGRHRAPGEPITNTNLRVDDILSYDPERGAVRHGRRAKRD